MDVNESSQQFNHTPLIFIHVMRKQRVKLILENIMDETDPVAENDQSSLVLTLR